MCGIMNGSESMRARDSCNYDPLAVIRGLFLAPQLLPSIQYCSREGAEPRPCTLTRQLSKDDEAAKLLPAH